MSEAKRPKPRPYFLINQLQLAMAQRLDHDLRQVGLTSAVARVLTAIANQPQISSSDLAKMLGISPQSIKQSILSLESIGLIERRVAAVDHRVRSASLTDKGWAVRDRVLAAINAMYADVYRGLTKREMATLTRLLARSVLSARPQSLASYDLSDVTGEATDG